MKTYKSNLKRIELKFNNTEFKKVKVKAAQTAYNVIKEFYHDDINIYESFFILLLNRQNITIGYAKISQGGVAGTVVDKSIVAKYCIDALASGVIIAHNHPSGTLRPSEADYKITKEIKAGLKLFDIQLLDHIILTDQSYVSMAENGEI